MTDSPLVKSLRFKSFGFLSLLAILLASCMVISCSDDEPEVIFLEPETFVYLVTLNDEPDLKSLTIVDSLNGSGSMVVPDIPAHLSNTFDLVIDRVDASRANISATQPGFSGVPDVNGAGFFAVDSVYLELTIDGFTNRDILTGNR